MPDNFVKTVDDGDQSIWKCVKCNRKFKGVTQPKRHTCGARKKDQEGTPNQVFTPGNDENATP